MAGRDIGRTGIQGCFLRALLRAHRTILPSTIQELTREAIHRRNTSPTLHPVQKISLTDDWLNENALPRACSLNRRSSRRDRRLRKVANGASGHPFSNTLHSRSGFSE